MSGLRRLRQALWTDTLTRRLFLLLWGTLVLSHVLGFSMAHLGSRGPQPGWGGAVLVPGMPPVPGWTPPPHPLAAPGAAPAASFAASVPGPRMAPPNLWLDYLVRVLVMAAAAWLGARWLTRPVRRLTQASLALSDAVGRKVGLPELDERTGPIEVRQAAQVFNHMARQLGDRFEERSLLMASISHDLRTPLTRLRMRLERLRPDPVAERCVADVHDINALIDGVLDALNEERRQEPWQAIDVPSLVAALVDDRAEDGQPVSLQPATGLPEAGGLPRAPAVVRAQPVALRRVLDNLIDNAVRHGGCARVGVWHDVGCLRVSVDDDGPGIPAGDLDAVFKPFFRLDGSRSRDTGGVGLGLYIARELTVRQGGRLALANRAEGGLRATIELPCCASE